jgi:hypothetical protein
MAQESHVGGVPLGYLDGLRAQGWTEEEIAAEEARINAENAAEDARAAPNTAGGRPNAGAGTTATAGGRANAGVLSGRDTQGGRVNINNQPGAAVPSVTSGDATKKPGWREDVELGRDPLWATKEAANAKGRAEEARLEARRLGQTAETASAQYADDLTSIGHDVDAMSGARSRVLTEAGRDATAAGLDAQNQLTNLGASSALTARGGSDQINAAGATGAGALSQAGTSAVSTARGGSNEINAAGATGANALSLSGERALSNAAVGAGNVTNAAGRGVFDLQDAGAASMRVASDAGTGVNNAAANGANALGLAGQGAISTAAQGGEAVRQAAVTGATDLQGAGRAAVGTARDMGQDVSGTGSVEASALRNVGNAAVAEGVLSRERLGSVGNQAQAEAARIGGNVTNGAAASTAIADAAAGRAAVPQAEALAALEAIEGPSAAQAQLQTGINRAEQSNLSLARSGRGWGGSASALARAIDANAVQGQEAANTAASLRAQETAQWRTRQGTNLNAAGTLTAQQRALNDSTQLAATAQADAARIAGAQQALAGVGMNVETQRAAEQAALEARQLGLTAEQAAANARLSGATTAAQLGVEGSGQQITAEQAAAATRLAGATTGAELGQTAAGQNLAAADAAARNQVAAATAAGQFATTGAGQNLTAAQASAATRLAGASTAAELGVTATGQQIAAEQAAAATRLGAATSGAELNVTAAGQRIAAEQAAAATRLGAATSGAQLSFAGTQSEIAAAQAAADARARGIDQGLTAQQAAAANELAGAGLQANTAAQAAAIQNAGLGLSGNLMQTGTSLGYQGDTLAAQATQAQAVVDAQNADRALQKYGIDQGVALQKDSGTMQLIGAGLGAAATVAPFLLAASDRDAKQEIRPASNLKLRPRGDDPGDPYGINNPTAALGAPGNPAGPGGPDYDRSMKAAADAAKKEELKQRYGQQAFAGLANIGQGLMNTQPNPYAMGLVNRGNPYAVSDERKKSNLRRKAGDAVSEAPGYSYEYKDPEAHGEGAFYGPMAQDLEKTPVGRSTIKVAPDGTKMVDTSRLTLVNTAALQELQGEVDSLRAQYSGGTKRAGMQTDPEFDAHAYNTAAEAAHTLPRTARGGARDMAPDDARPAERGRVMDAAVEARPRPAAAPTLAEADESRRYRELEGDPNAPVGFGWDTVYVNPEDEERKRRARPSSLRGLRMRNARDVEMYDPERPVSL